MTTEQINLRLDAETVAALEHLADSASLDRSAVVRRLLEDGIERWRRTHALESYQRGEISIGRAADEAGVSVWEAIVLAREAGIAHPARVEDVDLDIDALSLDPGLGHGDDDRTLADLPPTPGGILLVGINPARRSVAAGHYYQGTLGRRLWKRLARLGLLVDPEPGAEDVAFARMGHGLTDIVKRPTDAAGEVSAQELEEGAAALREKIAHWRPGLVVFVFKQAAVSVLPRGTIKPGIGPPVGGVPTFLLSGPYAPSAQAAAVDRLLTDLVASRGSPDVDDADVALTQRITDKDLVAGRIRLPLTSVSTAKRLLPSEHGKLQVVLRGRRLLARYDPRLAAGDDRERSGVISFAPADLVELVSPQERLRVSAGRGGVVRLD